MMMKTWSGSAVGLALCGVALAGCNSSSQSADQPQASASASASGVQVDWSSKTEEQLREAIANAPANGLRPYLFLKGGEKGAALTEAALKYASALANGYSNPNKLFEVYTIPHQQVDVSAGLQQAIQQGDVKSWLDSLVPQTDEYRAISQAHLHYLQLAAKAKLQPIPDGKPIKPGNSDTRMPLVIAALSAVGYLNDPVQAGANSSQPAAHANTSRVYSPDLVTAVKRVQADWGFKTDGIIGGDTLDALNAGPAYRARQLAIAMEKLRWLPRNPPGTRIDVNTAGAFLDYYRDGQHIDRRNVVTGQPDKPTPQLQAPIVRLVAKPTWTVPKGIGEKELASKSQSWLQQNNFALKDGLYVQQSGPKNSLGLVKFDMQDDQAIYLHDTPEKSWFATDDRHRSHGCVRVQDAVQFAAALAQQEQIGDKFAAAMQKGGASLDDGSDPSPVPGDDQTFIKLPNPIPVRLLYQTVFWDGTNVQFRPDVYGWDENVAKAIQLEPGPPVKIRQPQSSDDIGP